MAPDTLLIGVETRTSAPVRVLRDPRSFCSVNTRGLYPIGEGAGYAGGIMTAAVDGVAAAEAIVQSELAAFHGNVLPEPNSLAEQESLEEGRRQAKYVVREW
jgi:hypothetical protein